MYAIRSYYVSEKEGSALMNESSSSGIAGQAAPAVLQVLPRLDTGGVERGTIEIAEALRDAGARPVVVSAGGQLERELDRLDAIHVRLRITSYNVCYTKLLRTARARA